MAKRLLILSFLLIVRLTVFSQSHAFTYQGRLCDGGAPSSGTYEFIVSLYDGLTGSGKVAGPTTNAAVNVSNGLFVVTVDLGAQAFPGADRWLEISVRRSGTNVPFTTLTPRQQISATPYSLMAMTAGTAVSALNVAPGSVGSDQLGVGAVSMTNLNSNLLERVLAFERWQFDNKPVITSTNVVRATAGDMVWYRVIAQNNPPFQYSFDALPPGMGYSSDPREIGGTPPAGTYTVYVSAKNIAGTTTLPVTIIVSP